MIEFIRAMTGLAAVLLPVWIVWLVLHYRAQRRRSEGMDDEAAVQLQELQRLAEQMAERIKTLESILDAEAPEWRDYDGER